MAFVNSMGTGTSSQKMISIPETTENFSHSETTENFSHRSGTFMVSRRLLYLSPIIGSSLGQHADSTAMLWSVVVVQWSY